jgi:hypothetical protein
MYETYKGLFPWSEAQFKNFSEMYAVVKRFYRTPSMPEVAAIFPLKEDGLYDADASVFITPSNPESHLFVKKICEDFEQKNILVCCWHNHVHANTYSPNDVYTLLSRPNLTSVVIDSHDRILVLHKTHETFKFIDKYVKEYIEKNGENSREEAIMEIGKERVMHEVAAAKFFMKERQEYKEKFEKMSVDEVVLDIESYTKLQEEIRQVVFAEFRQKCGTHYFAMLKNAGNKFLLDTEFTPLYNY